MGLIDAGRAAVRGISGDVRSRAIWSAMDAGLGPLSALVLAAGLLRTLGAQDYGLIVMALAVSNLSTSINPAIAATTTKFVSEAIGSGNTQVFPVARIVTASLVAVTAINFLFVLAALLFAGALASLVFGGGVAAADPGLRAVLILAVVAICVQQLDAIFAAALRGLEKFAHQAVMELCARLLLVTAVIAVAFVTHSVRASLGAYCCVYGISALTRGIIVRGASPEKRLFALPDAGDVRRLLGFGGWMWLNVLASVAYGTLDRILVGRVLGAAAAAHFSVYTQLAQLVHFIPTSLFAFSYPMFSRLRSSQGPGSVAVAGLYRSSFRACVLIGGALLLALLLCRGPLVHLLGGHTFQPNDSVLFLLGLSYFTLTFNIVPYYFLLGIGESRTVSLLNSVSMAAAVLCMTVLIPAYGENGAALARFAYGFGALTLIYQSRKAMHR